MKILYFDTETTGVGDEAKIVQFAAIYSTGEVVDQLFSPGVPIELEAMATHHITEKMVAEKPAFSTLLPKIEEDFKNYVVVAHNAKFDIGRLMFEGMAETPKFAIDTLRIARHLLQDDLDSFKLQVLRYFFNIEIEAEAHNALGDVKVLQLVFEKLFEIVAATMDEEASQKEVLAEMLNLSKKPVLLKKFPFGKHKGEEFDKVPKDYLAWCSRTLTDMEEDLAFSVSHFLNV